ncbi:putative tetratricopeptide-like helical domain superfamily [Septoria linicola]|nr:putative tetratricopeptide-like helical domain superfamily [Septoria linicola]
MAQTQSAAEASYDHHSKQLPATPDSPSSVQWEPKDGLLTGSNNSDVRPGTPNSGEYAHNRAVSASTVDPSPSRDYMSMKRKPVPSSLQPDYGHGPEVRIQHAPASPVNISMGQMNHIEGERASIQLSEDERRESRGTATPDSGYRGSVSSIPMRPAPKVPNGGDSSHSRKSSGSFDPNRIDEEGEEGEHEEVLDGPSLQYHAFPEAVKKSNNRASQATTHSNGSGSSSEGKHRSSHSHSGSGGLGVPRTGLSRPASAYALGNELRGRTLSPLSAHDFGSASPARSGRDLSSQRRSPLARPHSYIELLANVPYSQQIAPNGQLNNAGLQSVVGNAASLLDTKKTLDMYRANVKKTHDPAVQYEFAIFMINAARDIMPEDGVNPTELTNEAKHILQKLSDRAYPFAQYYLADGYFSGLFNKGKPDHDKAFPLFVAASKHGHAEAGYRAALCYEFGWGCAKSYPKAVQFYKASASKNHPGAATRLGLAQIRGDMGLDFRIRNVYREGVKWLKRASESADPQYNAGPFELGMLHLTGYGDDIFKDEAYAVQLITQAAELGHVQANFFMGQAYENGLYGCPKDAALSVHFYNGSASRGHVEGMMALCAWYMVGAEPVLERDEAEAYAWAKMAAETGWAKAEYAIGYFTEMGIGCRRDPLEANVWYVRAADQGNETARQRLAIIRAAASGASAIPMSTAPAKSKDLAGKKKWGLF